MRAILASDLPSPRHARRNSRRVPTWLAASSTALAVLAASAGCTASVGDDSPLVVVTTNILGDVVGQLVGDQAEIVTLIPPDADPHSFEISAREAAQVQDADLIVANGLGLEEGLQQHVNAAAAVGVEVVTAGEFIVPLRYSTEDEEGALDPHLWTDPQRMLDVVDGLERTLSQAVPGIDVGSLADAATAYRFDLEQLDAEMAATFKAIPAERRALVTNHHVFGYLADRFDFHVIGAVVPSGTTLASPSASDLSELTAAIDRAGVTTIFADTSQPDRLVQVLAEEAHLDVTVVALHTESLSAPGGGAENYLEMMRSNERLIASGLSP